MAMPSGLFFEIGRLKNGEKIMINAAIVGMGRWGQTLVNSIAEGSHVIRFVAGTTRTPSKVTEYASENGIRLCENYEDVIKDDQVDAVVLAKLHRERGTAYPQGVGHPIRGRAYPSLWVAGADPAPDPSPWLRG